MENNKGRERIGKIMEEKGRNGKRREGKRSKREKRV